MLIASGIDFNDHMQDSNEILVGAGVDEYADAIINPEPKQSIVGLSQNPRQFFWGIELQNIGWTRRYRP